MRVAILSVALLLGAPAPARARETTLPAGAATAPAAPRAPSAASPNPSSRLKIPPLTGRIVDPAGVMRSYRSHELLGRLAQLEQTLGVQLVVLVVESTGPEPIESFALRAAETYKPGQAGRDNGLLLVATQDRRQLRLEVGYGLEEIVTDAWAAAALERAGRVQAREFGGSALEQQVARFAGEVIAYLQSRSDDVRAARGRGQARNVSQALSSPWWLGALLLLLLAWVTVGARKLGKTQAAPLSDEQRRALQHQQPSGQERARGLATFIDVLMALLSVLPLGGSRGSKNDSFRGGGGRFGGGGATGRDDQER